MKKMFDKNHLNDAILIVSFISILAAFLSLACYGPSFKGPHAKRTELIARSTLRALGETELAYQYSNNDRHYGSWEALVETEYIARGYHRGSLIENYSLWTAAFNPESWGDNLAADYPDNKFTAVAFPRITRPPGYLSTFAIREDQVLRVYKPTVGVNPWGANGDWGARTWEPIR